MPLDPDIKAYLLDLVVTNAPKLWEAPLASLRENRRQLQAAVEHVPVGKVDDHELSGPGGPLPVRVYRPTASTSAAPLLIYLHGGGFVFGDIASTDPLCRRLCRESGAVVVSVEYRLAPEHPYPAAVEDSLYAVRWALANATTFGADATRTVVAGDSAGGNLAATAAFDLRDTADDPAPHDGATTTTHRGPAGPTSPAQPSLAGLVLIYPVTDMRDLPYPSRTAYADGYGLSAADMEWFYQQYLPDGDLAEQAWASPMVVEDLSGLPPTLLLTAEYDPLRSEAERFGERLREAGVELDYECFRGMNHGALTNAAGFAAGARLRARLVSWLKEKVGDG